MTNRVINEYFVVLELDISPKTYLVFSLITALETTPPDTAARIQDIASNIKWGKTAIKVNENIKKGLAPETSALFFAMSPKTTPHTDAFQVSMNIAPVP